MDQATRATPDQIAKAHRRRHRAAARVTRRAERRAHRQPITWATVAGYAAMTAFAAVWVAVCIGWLARVESWPIWGA